MAGSSGDDLDISVVELVDRAPMDRPEGLVYSTDPQSSLDSKGRSYVVKGPSAEIVVAEAAAYLLARELGLRTPKFALGRYPSDDRLWFASVKEEGALRTISGLIAKGKLLAEHAYFLAELTAFDAWIGNTDRNMGNVLAKSGKGGPILVAIDFEKAQSLRPHSLIQSAMIEPKKLRPTGELGFLLRPPLQWDSFLRRLGGLDHQRIVDIVRAVAGAVGPECTWAESMHQTLRQRKQHIGKILKEVWG